MTLITSPAHIVIKAANEFKDKTTAPNQLWQTDFTYPRSPAGAGIISPPSSTISHAIVAWKLCATMKPTTSPPR